MWSCRYCTLNNPEAVNACTACGHRNRKSVKYASGSQLLSRISNDVAHNLSYALEFLGLKPQPQPPIHVQVVESWQCGVCGTANPYDVRSCVACTSYRPSGVAPSSSTSWHCPRCGLQQPMPPLNNSCPLCRSTVAITNGHRRQAVPPVSPRSKKAVVRQLPTIEDSSNVDQVYAAIEDFYRQTGDSFIDDSFPHANRSIGDLSKLDVKNVKIIWLRPAEIYTKEGRISPWTVFNNPRPTDIEQGILGNCWLLSSLAVIAERPEILKQIVRTPKYNHAGVYKVRLCVDGLWQTIFVDDFFPCYTNTRSMVFAVGRNNQLWVSLIEKALAKTYGSYSALKAGRTVEALSTLTGAPCEHIDLEVDMTMTQADAFSALELIWARLLSAKDANFLMGCSCGSGRREVNDKEYARLGLMSRHAYSILDVRQYGIHRLMRLRNPWGKFVWLGEWSGAWTGWTPEAKVALGFDRTKKETGTFWIPFERFVKHFDSVEVAAFNPHWSAQRFKFDLEWEQASIMKVTVREPTEMSFSLFQRHARTSIDKADLLLLVHKEDRTIEGRPGDLITRSSRRCMPNVRTEDRFFEPGTYIVCAMSFLYFYENKKIPATMVVHAAKPVEATMESAAPDVLRQSLVQMTLKEARAEHTLPNVRVYNMSAKFSGFLLMVDNLDESHCVQLKTDCSRSQVVVSSRGELVVADCLPPLHRQIVIVLTHCEPTQPFVIEHLLKQRITKQSKLGDFALYAPGSQHEPGIDTPWVQSVLHGPKPLYL